MKQLKLLTMLMWANLLAYASYAQESSLKPSFLQFSDPAQPTFLTTYGFNSLSIIKGLESSFLDENEFSTGTANIRSLVDMDGFTIQDVTAMPRSMAQLNRRTVLLSTDDGLTKETWRIGVTEAGKYDEDELFKSGFFIERKQTAGNLSYALPVFFAEPNRGYVGIGTIEPEARLHAAKAQVGDLTGANPGRAVLFENNAPSGVGAEEQTLLVRCSGTGGGIRVGGFFLANNSTGPKFGLFSRTSSAAAGTQYAIYGDVVNLGGPATKYAGYFNGDVAYIGSLINLSDSQFKKDVQTSPYGLETIQKLRPVTYDFQHKAFEYLSLPQGKQLGFIAQELEKVIPELVSNNSHPIPNGKDETLVGATETLEYKGVNYIGLIPVLTKAIQEQQEEIETLIEEKEVLENRLNELEAKLNALLQQQTTPAGNGAATVTPAATAQPEGVYLQNFPNPFSQSTTIVYQLPTGVKQAQLVISNMQGQIVRKVDIEAQKGAVELSGADYAAGTFTYSLVADGKILMTQQLVVAK